MRPDEVIHLRWIYHRLVNVHGENKNYDYMLKLNKIIKKEENKNEHTSNSKK